MPKRYAREFRRGICERLVSGERISKLSEESGVSSATLERVAGRISDVSRWCTNSTCPPIARSVMGPGRLASHCAAIKRRRMMASFTALQPSDASEASRI